VGTSVFDETKPLSRAIGIAAGSENTDIPLIGTNTFDYRIDTIWATNNDVIDHTVEIHLSLAGGSDIFTTSVVPAGAGLVGVPPVEIFQSVLGALSSGLAFDSQSSIEVIVTEAIGSTANVEVYAFGGFLP
jgi:hypothetical protein